MNQWTIIFLYGVEGVQGVTSSDLSYMELQSLHFNMTVLDVLHLGYSVCICVWSERKIYSVCERELLWGNRERKKEGNGQMRDLVHCVHVQIETNEIGYFDTVWWNMVETIASLLLIWDNFTLQLQDTNGILWCPLIKRTTWYYKLISVSSQVKHELVW